MSNKWEMLGQLQEQSTRLRKVEKQLDKLQNERYQLVQSAHEKGVRISEICEATGLSRPGVYRILSLEAAAPS
ncbi:helix-turn-helix domain-containing protein [Lawsonella clevelandensis]|uniref:Resolvase HTH domain-containing protein n=2 Tax=Lawsonella clevelandensis TaxID=1528099 RepID=A0A0M4LZC8_9ACTN|nr:helix-turn-helix domain-containing protein [Lawsonella clevelandensis]ALE19327.1 hypothetical protein AL705_06990 [Lawsonella clevelandensis]MDU7193408.1 helix-turn-helix domain-containing protein [Lawsonella clevelandensis]